jgi:hypothetical protein
MSHVEQLVLQAKTCFQAKDYETCMSLTDEVLRADPGNTEASWLMKEAQRQWEDQRSIEQLEIYVENLKKEAMDLFDNEHYEQCLGMFRFLAELEPENHTLRDYVKLTQQMIVETIGPAAPPESAGEIISSPSDLKESEALVLGSSEPEMGRSNSLSGLASPELEARVTEFEKPITTADAGTRSVLDPEAIPESLREKIIQEYLASAGPRHRERSRKVWLIALVMIIPIGIASFWLFSAVPASWIEIYSTPEKATVFIDSKRVGETPIRQGILPGNHILKIEKRGYLTHNRNISIERTQAAMLELQLERAKTSPPLGVQPTVPTEPQPIQTLPPVTATEPVDRASSPVQIAQSVIHHHLLGSCTGRLKIDGEKISFWAPGNARDGFTRKIRQIISFSLDEKLLIEFKDKAYRFEALARDAKDNRERLTPFYEQIKMHKAGQLRKP